MKSTKKSVSLFAVAIAAILMIASIVSPLAKATYNGEKAVLQNEELKEIKTDDKIAPENIVVSDEINEISENEEMTGVQISRDFEMDGQNNQIEMTKGNESEGQETTNNDTSTGNKKAASPNKSKDSAPKESADFTFTPDDEQKAPSSSSPVRLSQAAPYYYNKLSATEKNLYDMLLDGMNNLVEKITLGGTGTKVQIDKAFNALIRDQAQIFWVDTGYAIHTTTSDEGDTFALSPFYSVSKKQISSAKARLNSAINQVLGTLNGAMTQFEIEAAVHDYLVKKVGYSNAAAQTPQKHLMAYTAYGALVDGSAVCEGYAEAFQLILNKVGIQTTLVTGKASGSDHMWNMTKIDGKWYHVDVTYDDPNNGNANSVRRNYLNLATSEISKTRIINNGLFSYPQANSTEKNYFRASGLYFSSYNSTAAKKLYNEVVRAVGTKNTVVQIRVGGKIKTAVNALLASSNGIGLNAIKSAAQKSTGKKISKLSYSADASLGIVTIYLTY